MSERKVVIYGAGHLGCQILNHVRNHYPAVTILGFADDFHAAGKVVTPELKTLGPVADVARQAAMGPESVELVFAIGYSNMLARRAALESVTALGYRLFSVVHPQAIIEPNADHGAGSVILGGAILDQEVSIGRACFIDIGVRLGAGTVVGNSTYICSGTSTGSRVRIGDDCFVGMDCTITTDVNVGSNVFLNAKTLVPRDVASNTKVVELHKSKNLPLSAD